MLIEGVSNGNVQAQFRLFLAQANAKKNYFIEMLKNKIFEYCFKSLQQLNHFQSVPTI